METASTEARELLQRTFQPLYASRGWLKFLGIMSIIGGAFMVLTIWGILIAWLPIWMGVLLFQAGSTAEQGFHSADPSAINRSLGKLNIYFIIMSVLVIIQLAFVAIALLFGIFAGFGALMQAGSL